MKYAVIIPFEDLEKSSKIINAKSVDTFTEGPVYLTKNSYILCPKGEGKKVKASNPNIIVIEYEGERVYGYANMFISELGYIIVKGGAHGFLDSEKANKYTEIVSERGYSTVSHFYSKYKERERMLSKMYTVVGVFKLIIDQNIQNKIDRKQLVNDLRDNDILNILHYTFSEEDIHRDEDEIEYYKEYFIQELKQLGIEIEDDEVDNLDNIHFLLDKAKDVQRNNGELR